MGLIKNRNHGYRVAYGQDAERIIPWQVSIRNGRGQHMCGGVIINEGTILTAAHCCSRRSRNDYSKHKIINDNCYAVAVRTTRKNLYEMDPQTRRVSKIILHEKYVKLMDGMFYVENDFAILKLVADLKFSDFVKPACLPSDDHKYYKMRCFTSGWGEIEGE